MKEEIIQTVHDQDLEKLLIKLDLLEKLKNGLLKCALCDTLITLDNLQGIFKEEEEIGLICDKPECYKRLMEKKL